MAFVMLKDGAEGFGDVNSPKPMLLAPSDAGAETVLADLALSSEAGHANANLGAVLLSWGAGPESSTFDLHVQLFAPVHTAIHITGNGGGVVSNTWGWGGDHNLTTNRPMAPTLSVRTQLTTEGLERPKIMQMSRACVRVLARAQATSHWLGALSGLRVDSEGPTWLLGTQFEHHREIMCVAADGHARSATHSLHVCSATGTTSREQSKSPCSKARQRTPIGTRTSSELPLARRTPW